MAGLDQRAGKQLGEMTECSICMSAFTDPRMLPCIHTLCFNCLQRTSDAAQKKPGDDMPCPLCRKEFVIPKEGINGVQKNFFMENLLEFRTTLHVGSSTMICDMCNIRNEGKTGQIPTATMRCMECQDNYCDSCVKVHQFQKVTKDHQIVNIGTDTKSEMKRFASIEPCTDHIHKPLDYYCAECKKIVCVSCFVESHKLHDCKDVTKVEKEFRQTIAKKALKISDFTNEMLLVRNDREKRKLDFLKVIVDKEKEINSRSQKLTDMINRHTMSLLDELSVIKSNNLKEMEIQMEEIERCCSILTSFETYCNELTLKGSASDICSSFDHLCGRADDLERDHVAFIGGPHQSVKVTFRAADLSEVLQMYNDNLVGNIKEIPVSRQMNLAATGDQMSIELVGSLEAGENNSIWGVTHLKNRIYVLSKHNKLILAFESEAPFCQSREIPLREVAVPRDLAACDTNNCLYVVDDEGKAIWKIRCTEFSVNRWLTGIGNPFKISVTKDGRVLIPREGTPCTIELIGSNARLEKSIGLPDEIKHIQYAIQSPRETIIISYGENYRGRIRGLLEISMEGNFLKRHSIPPEIGSEMKDPRHMAFGRGDLLFVTDCGNDRVIAFDSQLQGKKILLDQRTDGIHMPYRVCYIEDKEYLIVVHSSGYKVVVYKCS